MENGSKGPTSAGAGVYFQYQRTGCWRLHRDPIHSTTRRHAPSIQTLFCGSLSISVFFIHSITPPQSLLCSILCSNTSGVFMGEVTHNLSTYFWFDSGVYRCTVTRASRLVPCSGKVNVDAGARVGEGARCGTGESILFHCLNIPAGSLNAAYRDRWVVNGRTKVCGDQLFCVPQAPVICWCCRFSLMGGLLRNVMVSFGATCNPVDAPK